MQRLEPYTLEGEQAIEKLKKKTAHLLTSRELQDETLFYRFLKDRNFNIKQAETMLLKHISDYKMYDVENVMKSYSPPEHVERFNPNSFIGFDKEGCIVRYADFGNVDPKGMFSLFKINQLILHNVIIHERDFNLLTEQSKKLGKSVTQIVLIFDLDNLSLFQATHKKGINFLLKYIKLCQDNYPERYKALFIINTSFYFNVIFSIIKNVIGSHIIEKIYIFGKDGWKEALLEMIDADELPAFLGGNKTDPDGNPLCNTFVVHSKKIPEELYKNKLKKSLHHENGVKKITINRFSSTQITFDVDEPNTQIEWEFETKSRDIGFALYYQNGSDKDSSLVELMPKERIDTHLSTETGIYKCDKIGHYIKQFDNSYSWFFSKELYYRTRIVKKKENILLNETN